MCKDEWMLYTFIAYDLSGEPFETTIEGVLEWHPVESLQTLPMAEGDGRIYCLQFLNWNQYGTFYYTEEFKLLKEEIQNSVEGDGQ